MAPDARLLKESLAHVESRSDQLVLRFYALLFGERPDLRELFPAAMDTQRDRFFNALVHVVQGAERLEFRQDYLAQLARDHRKYGVRPDHYDAVGRALIGALRLELGDAWTAAMEQEWASTYALISRMMVEAAERDAQENPAWWMGEVISHRRRANDIVVLTVRPDSHFPYEAGQHVGIETARWPRVWRPYSIANAPRDDGLLELHVRAVGAGWVSSALVYHTQPGDTVRLSAARGPMRLSADSSQPVVCVAGGTGLAPIKALVEEIARSQPQRTTHLFFGARQHRDLYDLQALSDLMTMHPRLVVVPAVSHDSSYVGERGLISDVAFRYGAWDSHDVYVCGSADMVRTTVGGLQERGVSLARIRYDDFG